MTFTLTYVERFDIKDEDLGLTEPSGLALAPGGDGLWTISDDTKRVFRIGSKGKLRRIRPFKVPKKGLEGITIEPTGAFLFAVREENNRVLKLDIAKRAVVEKRRLAQMDGFGGIARHFGDEGGNKGLEGIAWNAQTGTLFALKEGLPGLIVEISADLATILGHRRLGARNGFTVPGAPGVKADYSGICYDPTRRAFWIVSDKAKRLFLYDFDSDRVVQGAALGYEDEDGAYRLIEKAEGVAFDPSSGRLYVVSDAEARLYVYDVGP